MSKELLSRLERYRINKELTKFELCNKLKIPETYIYRWTKKEQVGGIYKRLIEEFLENEGF